MHRTQSADNSRCCPPARDNAIHSDPQYKPGKIPKATLARRDAGPDKNLRSHQHQASCRNKDSLPVRAVIR